MKIAHVIRALDVGGAERVTAELASTFAESGDDVTIFVGWPTDTGSPAQRRLSPKVHVEYIDGREHSRFLTYCVAALWVWKNRARLAEFDVLHCHLTYGALIATMVGLYRRAKRIRRPRIVETYHSVGAPITPLVRWVHSTMAARRDVFVLMAVDSYWLRFARNHRDLTVRTVLNGASTPDIRSVDHAALTRYRVQLGIPSDTAFVVGSIGMLRSDRRPSVFVPIIAALVRELGDEIHWIFAGDGPERSELQRLVENAGLAANVHFAGVVSDVRYPLALMNLHFTITVGEVGGVAAIECALAGVPSIALQASADYQPDPQDWIWSNTCATNVAEAALQLLRHPEERMALARRQRQYALTHHSIEQMARSYREVYQPA